MKALSLWQPWASLICPGHDRSPIKTVETRSTATKYRGRVLICSSGTIHHRRALVHETAGMFVTGPPNRRTITVHDDGPGTDVYMLDSKDRIGDGLQFPIFLPLGAALGVATIVDCLPMTTHHDIGDPECIVVHGDGTADHAIPLWHADQGPSDVDRARAEGYELVRIDEIEVPDGAALIRDITDQVPYGDFTPGRFGWVLADIQSFRQPIPAKGMLGLWDPHHERHGDLMDRVAAQLAG